MNDDLDVEGDILKMVWMGNDLVSSEQLSENNLWTTIWRFAQPMVFGWEKSHQKWVSNHYDADNVQLYFVDREYHTYTPGVFEHHDESLESATKRKLQLAFEGLDLKPGDRVLDVGAGWGSFLRYAAQRGVHVTGITLSNDQKAYIQQAIKDENLDAQILHQNFFSYEPKEKFDAIVINGVMEELSDYPESIRRIANVIKPGRKVYLDFVSAVDRYHFPAFMLKYIYQGTTRRVYLPEFLDAVTKSPFELVSLSNDRLNYFLTTRAWFERFEEQREAIKKRWGERFMRMYRLYLSGAHYGLGERTHFTTAYRMFLELPEDYRPAV